MAQSGDDALVARLERARDHGYFGPGPVLAHLAHARGFGAVAERVAGRVPARAVDLGSGGGVPGLVLAWDWPTSVWLLVDAGQRRAADLEAAVADLGLTARVAVRTARAEDVAHEPNHRERADLVTARSFAPPAVTAEIATGLVAPGGWVIVSEPPGGDPERWPEAELAGFGFGPAELVVVDARTYAALPKRSAAPETVPRPTRRLVKRPAWS
jgi:16S rRNA (guanine527-N7)-methyltransferase